MQLHDLVSPIEKQTDAELLERLRELRHTRTVIRPAAKRHAKKAESKGRVTRSAKVANLFAGLSAEELANLIASLEG